MDLLLYLSPYKGFESYNSYTGQKMHLKPEDLVWIQLRDNLAVKSGACHSHILNLSFLISKMATSACALAIAQIPI